MMNRSTKLNYKRVQTVDITGSGSARIYRVGIVIPATCYGIRFEIEPSIPNGNNASEDIVLKWKLVRDLNIEKDGTPEYDGQLDEDLYDRFILC